MKLGRVWQDREHWGVLSPRAAWISTRVLSRVSRVLAWAAIQSKAGVVRAAGSQPDCPFLSALFLAV